MEPLRIIDISQPIQSSTACFPGDIPFSRNITIDYSESRVINLSAFTMSPHVGTHADAPVHVQGDLRKSTESAGHMPLTPFVGPVAIVDISPWAQAITWQQVSGILSKIEKAFSKLPKRILFKTLQHIRYDIFEKEYAWFSPELITELAQRNIELVGIDTPSVDAVDSKALETHHALLDAGMHWLENLDLTSLEIDPEHPASYFLVATPLKFMELEASPVRAILLEFPR
jgi:arylformamidase